MSIQAMEEHFAALSEEHSKLAASKELLLVDKRDSNKVSLSLYLKRTVRGFKGKQALLLGKHEMSY